MVRPIKRWQEVRKKSHEKFKVSITCFSNFLFILITETAAERSHELLSPGWSFKGFFGKFDRASLQRGYQVYTEVCAACHSMKYLSYRNLSEAGGPEFTVEQAKNNCFTI